MLMRPNLTLDLSSSRIQMAVLGHTSTPFCFVIRQLLGYFPGQVQLSKVPFDDIYPVLPRSSRLSLVTSHFPVCCLTSCSRVVQNKPKTVSGCFSVLFRNARRAQSIFVHAARFHF